MNRIGVRTQHRIRCKVSQSGIRRHCFVNLRILEICTVRNWFIPQVGFLMRKLEIYAKYPIAYIQFFAQCYALCKKLDIRYRIFCVYSAAGSSTRCTSCSAIHCNATTGELRVVLASASNCFPSEQL